MTTIGIWLLWVKRTWGGLVLRSHQELVFIVLRLGQSLTKILQVLGQLDCLEQFSIAFTFGFLRMRDCCKPQVLPGRL